VGFDPAQPCFSDRLGFRGSEVKFYSMLPLWDILWFHGEVSRGEMHESRDLWTSIGGSSIVGDEELV
jgi:hypothetical protein